MELRRTLSLWLILSYGVGTILGAGVYVLVGKVAGYAGIYTPLSFLLASLVAAFTAISYARLSALHPKAAGEAAYVHAAFRKRWLTSLTGWMVVVTGVVSAAALTRGFAGYFAVFFHTPSWLVIILAVCALTLLALWGIGQSVKVAVTITLLEVAGLLIVIAVCALALPPSIPSLTFPNGSEWWGISLGTFLAFYAFIGFEDMVNLAEEVRNPRKNLPRAIFLALGIATLLYVLVALGAVFVLPLDELAATDAPFALLFQKQGLSPTLITAISLVAILNGVLVQIIMAARVLYGMATQHVAPHFMGYVNSTTQTPLLSTLIAAFFVLVLALWFPIVTLAQVTSFVILLVFALVNLALVILKKRQRALPLIGLTLSILLLLCRALTSTH